MRWKDIERVLIEIEKSNKLKPNQGWILVSREGLPIKSALSSDINDELTSAICAALVSMSNHAVQELSHGELKQILIEGVDGIIKLSKASKDLILCTLLKHGASLEGTFQNFNNKPPKMKDVAYVE
ncbi:MAG: roadblock/LC7 domain-containing protein [Promethearchaeota archaeon]